MSILSSIFGDANARYINSLKPVIDRINSLELEFDKLSDEELKEKTQEFRNRLKESPLTGSSTEAYSKSNLQFPFCNSEL